MGATVACAALILAACSSSGSKSSSSSGGGSSGGGSSGASAAGTSTLCGIPNQRAAINNSGSPKTGGTLTMLGSGDVDYMDPNVTYYTTGYDNIRMWSRNLYTYPAQECKTITVVPDLATGLPAITNNGMTYTVTLRSDVMWNTNPPRQVTGADVVRGIKRQCNPAQPFGGTPDYSNYIQGFNDFCTAFGKVSGTDANAMKSFMDSNNIAGVSVDPSNPQAVVFKLTQPVSFFTDILALGDFDPAPVEYENYIPASNDLAQHTIADGPYQVQSYDPAKTITYVRNPVWKASTDPVRKAYVDKIEVTETGNQQGIYQQILTNSPAADMMWDQSVPPTAIPGLLSSNDPRFYLQTEYSSNPYILFNTVSPNNGGALGKLQVRQAIEYALNRNHLIQNAGGPVVAPPLTHILPPGINGSTPNFDPYPYDTAKAKSMLAAAGYPNGLTLKFLYRPTSQAESKDFQTIQADLAPIGITVTGVGVPRADFYTKYLYKPDVAKNGTWDLAHPGWSPDWYGDAAASFFYPLLDGRVLPPSSSNFGL
ncbi:MAG TPA: ABC transporter substrate-binding protein, partial [Acidimicrobiales bacterium]|nr:ABC transporter substrate-binding protein [Acidimicrobiales bacterium]